VNPGLRGRLALGCVAAASIGFEIALSRYFSVTNWAEFGYWVISIAMLGYAASGVGLSLWPEAMLSRWPAVASPAASLMTLGLAAGFVHLTRNPLNPLEFQHPGLALGQVARVGAAYLVLFPFGLLTGGYVGSFFLARRGSMGPAYAADLTGAAAGATLVLVSLWFVPHAWLTLLLPLPLFAAALLSNTEGSPARRRTLAVAAVMALVAGEALMMGAARPEIGEFKPVYASLNSEGARVNPASRSPRGEYVLVDSYLERTEPDLSNNLARLGVQGPPAATGLYRDGRRMTGLPASRAAVPGYARASLDALPWKLRPNPRVLLVGTRGGFLAAEAAALGSASVVALEPEPVVRRLVNERMTLLPARGAEILGDPPRRYFAAHPAAFDIILLSADFADQAEAHRDLLTVEGLREAVAALAPGGLLVVPVSIRESVVYAARLGTTLRDAMGTGPADRIAAYRSAWSVRFLARAGGAFLPRETAEMDRFCDELSFDIVLAPGRGGPVRAAWNELPPTEADAALGGDDPKDALRGTLARLMGPGVKEPPGSPFDLSPATRDRPWLFHALHPSGLGKALPWLGELPQSEIGSFVNAAVLLQALLCAVPILLLPLLRRRTRRAGGGGRGALYFACLGIGFLFVEIALIEWFTLFLDDRTAAFSLVLAGMLAGAGAGSWASSRLEDAPERGLRRVLAWVVGGLVALAVLLPVLAGFGAGWPVAVRWVVAVAVMFPLAFGMGMPFPLALGRLTGARRPLVPWAFAVNGTCSVIATPLANLAAISGGLRTVLVAAAACYAVAAFSFPRDGGSR